MEHGTKSGGPRFVLAFLSIVENEVTATKFTDCFGYDSDCRNICVTAWTLELTSSPKVKSNSRSLLVDTNTLVKH